MAEKPKKHIIDTQEIISLLGAELESLSEDQLLAECGEDYGSVQSMVERFDTIVGDAAARSKRRRLDAARKGYRDAANHPETFSADFSAEQILKLTLSEKRALLERLTGDAGGEMTLAARNENRSETDIDAILRDLLIMGAIDEEGNIK